MTAQIFSFYGFKGGAGRSLLVANMAAALSALGKKVLMVDADFEAPGLGDFFDFPGTPTFARWRETRGLLELLTEVTDLERENDYEDEEDRKEKIGKILFPNNDRTRPPSGAIRIHNKNFQSSGESARLGDSISLAQQTEELESHGELWLLGPGSHSADEDSGSQHYAVNFLDINWHALLDNKGAELLAELAEEIAKSFFDYILIDARTGYNMSSVVLMRSMSSKIVCVGTWSTQSIDGLARVEPVLRVPLVESSGSINTFVVLGKTPKTKSGLTQSAETGTESPTAAGDDCETDPSGTAQPVNRGQHDNNSLEIKRELIREYHKDSNDAPNNIFEFPFLQELMVADKLLWARINIDDYESAVNEKSDTTDQSTRLGIKRYTDRGSQLSDREQEALLEYVSVFKQLVDKLTGEELFKESDSIKSIFRKWKLHGFEQRSWQQIYERVKKYLDNDDNDSNTESLNEIYSDFSKMPTEARALCRHCISKNVNIRKNGGKNVNEIKILFSLSIDPSNQAPVKTRLTSSEQEAPQESSEGALKEIYADLIRSTHRILRAESIRWETVGELEADAELNVFDEAVNKADEAVKNAKKGQTHEDKKNAAHNNASEEFSNLKRFVHLCRMARKSKNETSVEGQFCLALEVLEGIFSNISANAPYPCKEHPLTSWNAFDLIDPLACHLTSVFWCDKDRLRGKYLDRFAPLSNSAIKAFRILAKQDLLGLSAPSNGLSGAEETENFNRSSSLYRIRQWSYYVASVISILRVLEDFRGSNSPRRNALGLLQDDDLQSLERALGFESGAVGDPSIERNVVDQLKQLWPTSLDSSAAERIARFQAFLDLILVKHGISKARAVCSSLFSEVDIVNWPNEFVTTDRLQWDMRGQLADSLFDLAVVLNRLGHDSFCVQFLRMAAARRSWWSTVWKHRFFSLSSVASINLGLPTAENLTKQLVETRDRACAHRKCYDYFFYNWWSTAISFNDGKFAYVAKDLEIYCLEYGEAIRKIELPADEVEQSSNELVQQHVRYYGQPPAGALRYRLVAMLRLGDKNSFESVLSKYKSAVRREVNGIKDITQALADIWYFKSQMALMHGDLDQAASFISQAVKERRYGGITPHDPVKYQLLNAKIKNRDRRSDNVPTRTIEGALQELKEHHEIDIASGGDSRLAERFKISWHGNGVFFGREPRSAARRTFVQAYGDAAEACFWAEEYEAAREYAEISMALIDEAPDSAPEVPADNEPPIWWISRATALAVLYGVSKDEEYKNSARSNAKRDIEVNGSGRRQAYKSLFEAAGVAGL